MDKLVDVTQSEFRQFFKCEKSWWLKYSRGLRRDAGPALVRGSAVHQAIEHSDPAAARKYLADAGALAAFSPEEHDKAEVLARTCEAMARCALTAWPDWPTRREMVFRVPLVNPATGRASSRHQLAGKVDGLWYSLPPGAAAQHPGLKPGAPCLMEFKTTSRIDRQWRQRWPIDIQPPTYVDALSASIERDIRQTLVRAVKTTGFTPPWKQRKKVPDTVGDYCDRIDATYDDAARLYLAGEDQRYLAEVALAHTEDELVRHRRQKWEIHQRMLAVARGASLPVMNPNSCLTPYLCDFFDLCTGEATEADYNLVTNTHPELS